MKKMRKLLPAFAMLLVSAIMMSTASFAWFTMSASVTAQGMSVKAKAEGGLLISAATKTDANPPAPDVPTANEYATFVNFSDSTWFTNRATAIKPTSLNEGTWYTATAASPDSNVKNSTAYGILTNPTFENNNEHYFATKLYLKAAAEGTVNYLDVTSITVSFGGAEENSRNLNKALRIALKVGSDWFYFAPVYTSGVYQFVGDTDTSTEGAQLGPVDNTELKLGTTFTTGTARIYDNLVSNTATEVEVYIYYEGEDANCKSANAVDIQTLTVSIAFGCTQKTGA